ncbi:hypothetical protein C8J57DRAFT_1716738 [Mycena rebaudengoi]|nr:hypothetical protein C8J57DRAFT_1716738 [Mycena rebaudengoi]
MTEPGPPVNAETARYNTIHTSADLMCALIESEVALAVEPYQNALAELRRNLSEVYSAKNNTNIPGASSSIYQAQERELNELKSALAQNGIGIAQVAGRNVLRFIGERAAFIATMEQQILRHAPDLASCKPINPATIVEILVQAARQAADETHLAELSDRERAAKVLADGHRAEVAHLIEQRAELAMSLARERSTASEVNTQVSQLKAEKEAFGIRMDSARTEADSWKRTCVAAEEERDALKSRIDDGESYLTLVEAELDSWKTRYSAAQEESKTAAANREAELASAQAELNALKAEHLTSQEELQTRIRDREGELTPVKVELDAWKAKCLAVEKLMSADREGKLASAQAEAQVWKTKYLASDVEVWKSKCRDAEIQLAKALDKAKIAAGKWAARVAAWKNVDIDSIQQHFRQYVTNYENLEEERNRLRDTLARLYRAEWRLRMMT